MEKETKMTQQEMFNAAYLGVIAQGCPGVDLNKERPACAYIASNDGKVVQCGVGHIIGEEASTYLARVFCNEAVSDIVAYVADEASVHFEAKLPRVFHEETKFLDALQSAHDNAQVTADKDHLDFLALFEYNMRGLALEYSLEVPA